MSLQRECLGALLTLPLPLQRGQGAPAREPVISSEEHKQLMLFYHRRQEELKVAIGWQGQWSWAHRASRASPTGRAVYHPSTQCWGRPSSSPRLSPVLDRGGPTTGRGVLGWQEVTRVLPSVYMNYL